MSYSSLKTNVGIAVDLDNTMIGSASQSYNYPEEVQVVDRSLYTGAEIYISQKALDVYKYLSKQSRLIAVTTRSSSQFLRMTIAEHTKCAIFDNGATIMFDGKVDQHWRSEIIQSINQLPFHPLMQMRNFVDSIGKDRIIRIDEFEFFGIAYLNELGLEWMNHNFDKCNWPGYKTSLQGLKFYIIPDFINKGSSLTYAMKKLGIESIEAAGDSLPDLEMFKVANYCHVSPWGELENTTILEDHTFYPKYEGQIVLTGKMILETFCTRHNIVL